MEVNNFTRAILHYLKKAADELRPIKTLHYRVERTIKILDEAVIEEQNRTRKEDENR